MVYLDARHTKDEFSAEMDERIAIREKLLGFSEGTYIKVLEKFDGKVLNARFLKALREEASKQSQMLDKVGYNLLGLENKVSDVLSNYNSAHQEIESIMSSSSEIRDSIGTLSSANSKAADLLKQSFDTTDQADEKFNEFKTILGWSMLVSA